MRTFVVGKDGSMSLEEVNKPKYDEHQALVKTIQAASPHL